MLRILECELTLFWPLKKDALVVKVLLSLDYNFQSSTAKVHKKYNGNFNTESNNNLLNHLLALKKNLN